MRAVVSEERRRVDDGCPIQRVEKEHAGYLARAAACPSSVIIRGGRTRRGLPSQIRPFEIHGLWCLREGLSPHACVQEVCNQGIVCCPVIRFRGAARIYKWGSVSRAGFACHRMGWLCLRSRMGRRDEDRARAGGRCGNGSAHVGVEVRPEPNREGRLVGIGGALAACRQVLSPACPARLRRRGRISAILPRTF